MPENHIPDAKPDPEAFPGEFDFAESAAENPRMKRRSLKPPQESSLKPVSGVPEAAQELVREAPPLSTEAAQPKYTANPGDDDDTEINAEAQKTEPSPTRPASAAAATPPPRISSVRPSSTTNNPPASPHGTRPATLYYSTGPRKDKEQTSPMKSTPTGNPSPSPTTSSTSPARSTAPAASPRPSSVVDYRTNVERQAREQKSVGNVLAYLVYALIGLFFISGLLAGYGAYTVSKQLHQQSVTVDDLDARLSAQTQALTEQLKSTMATLGEAQAQIGRQQELILKQQETISKLLAVTQDTAAALRQERDTRASETASIRTRLKDLEYKGPSGGTTTQRY